MIRTAHGARLAAGALVAFTLLFLVGGVLTGVLLMRARAECELGTTCSPLREHPLATVGLGVIFLTLLLTAFSLAVAFHIELAAKHRQYSVGG